MLRQGSAWNGQHPNTSARVLRTEFLGVSFLSHLGPTLIP